MKRITGLFFLLGLLLIFGGSYLASKIQTAGGITVRDIAIPTSTGVTLRGLLYVPPNATAATPAPGVLAIHGYINSRETQDGFAIEFARRGYVVLAIDQTGHGQSGGAAFSQGFGGPDALAYMRAMLPMVDKANIGLEGHSMGGWAVLAAAAVMPNDYRSVVLEGSSTGKPFAAEGSPAWPRNLEVVYSRWDEFSPLMWGVAKAADVGQSAKLRAVFGTPSPVLAGRLYGDIGQGTARILWQPNTTHPGDHFSNDAIGRATDWFAATLKGGTPRPASDQIWIWKEVGTGIALIGYVLLLLGAFDLVLGLVGFGALRQAGEPTSEVRDRGWKLSLAAMAILPALTFYPVFLLGAVVLPPSHLLPQGVTNQLMLWALVNAVLTLLLGLALRGPKAVFNNHWLRGFVIAAITAGIGHLAQLASDRLFHTDFRFWVVAMKLPSPAQTWISLIYLVPFTLFFLVTFRALLGRIPVKGEPWLVQWAWSKTAMVGGFTLLLILAYGGLFATGALPPGFDALASIIAIQFLPLLAFVAAIAVYTWRRTNSYVPGAFLCGMVVTSYIVAGTATHVV